MTASFTPNGIITLTTDFGTRDPFVGLMKGVILSRYMQAKLIDLTHEIPPYRPAVAGFWLARSWQYFPTGTIHLAVVDPGVGTDRGLVAITVEGQLFIAPDNGLLEEVAVSADRAEWRRVDLERLRPVLPTIASNTFHGRDIFAPLVAEIATGRLQVEQVGDRLDRLISKSARSFGDEIAGEIMVIDHFGNLITNIEALELQRIPEPKIHFHGQVFDLHRTYGAAKRGEVIALINSFGVLELAQAQGNAQTTLAATLGERVVVRGG